MRAGSHVAARAARELELRTQRTALYVKAEVATGAELAKAQKTLRDSKKATIGTVPSESAIHILNGIRELRTKPDSLRFMTRPLTDAERPIRAIRETVATGRLMLQDMCLTEVPDLACATVFLQVTQIIEVNLSFNALQFLPAQAGVLSRYVVQFNVANNLLSRIDPWLRVLPRLRQLDASHNDIAAIPRMECPNLEVVDLSHNRISSINALGDKRELRVLRLGHCLLATLPAKMRGLARLEELDISNNVLITLALMHASELADVDAALASAEEAETRKAAKVRRTWTRVYDCVDRCFVWHCSTTNEFRRPPPCMRGYDATDPVFSKVRGGRGGVR